MPLPGAGTAKTSETDESDLGGHQRRFRPLKRRAGQRYGAETRKESRKPSAVK